LMELRENDTPWDRDMCYGAALGGHREVLQWLRANDCPWDKDTCSHSAGDGHLEVLQ
jgi:hypothetical protein